MAGDADMSGWTDLLYSSSKLIEQAAPSAQFPPLQRNLDQLESLSKKLKAKTLRAEAPSQSIAVTRLLAREGLNAEQLARDLKSFELKTTFEDVFPSEATTVEEYLQQVHEMTMLSSIQEAQKDNLKCFNDYMMSVLQEDWQKERRDFLESLSRISTLPRTDKHDSSSETHYRGQLIPATSSSQLYRDTAGLEPMPPLTNKPLIEQKAAAYAEVVKNLNAARERGLPFKPAASFKNAYESLKLEPSGPKLVGLLKIWHLVMSLMSEDSAIQSIASKRMSLLMGARRHLQWGHEKYAMDMIQSHPAQAALGGGVGNLQKIRAFLRIRLRDYGTLDFDAGDVHRQPPMDTTWQQIYFCLRTGYYDDAREVSQISRVSQQFTPLLVEWITTGGMVSAQTAAAASEECEKILRMVDRVGRASYDKQKLLLYAIISGSKKLIDRLLRELPTVFNTIEDFLWFMLSACRDSSAGPSSTLQGGMSSYMLEDLQAYLNKFEPSHYTRNGKDPLVYSYVLFLSLQLLPAVVHLSKEVGEDGHGIDAVHIAIVLADYGVLTDVPGPSQTLGIMDTIAETSSIIRQYGAAYLHHGNLFMAVEYYVQAAAAVGGGQLSWTGRCNMDQDRQRKLMLMQLLTEVLLHDGGIYFLLGSRGAGEEGQLGKYLTGVDIRQQFLLQAAERCQDAGLYDKAIEIQKRIGAFSAALNLVNKCLSEAISDLSRGRLDGESRIAGLKHTANDILETFKYCSEISPMESANLMEQQTVLRQLEAILSVHKLSTSGNHLDALREIARLSFLPLDPRSPDAAIDTYKNLSPHVEACVPGLLRDALQCLDSIKDRDTDGSLRALRAQISNFLAKNVNRNWPRDLYEKVARIL